MRTGNKVRVISCFLLLKEGSGQFNMLISNIENAANGKTMNMIVDTSNCSRR